MCGFHYFLEILFYTSYLVFPSDTVGSLNKNISIFIARINSFKRNFLHCFNTLSKVSIQVSMPYRTCIFENRSYYTDIMVSKSCCPIPALFN